MNNNEQAINLKKALELDKLVAKSEEKYSSLLDESFRNPPEEPKRTVFQAEYPKVESKIQVPWWVYLVAGFIFLPLPFIMYYVIKNRKKEDEDSIRNSPEYLQQCAQIDGEIAEKQAQADSEYEEKMTEFKTVTLPAYQKELSEWTEKHNAEVEDAKATMNNYKDELKKHYENTKIVPLQYRSRSALTYLYDMVSTSDYTVKEAIELYDRNKQRQLDEKRLNEQRRLNAQQQYANELAEQNAYLLEEQNYIADKARKDANRAAAVAAVQRHNLNKRLKK